MADQHPKKMLILYILKILREHTDENHTLSQHGIQELLESEYGMNTDRKTVRRNLSKLMEEGYPIRYQGSEDESDEITRRGRNGAEETILTNWYYVHEFTYGELSLLIDGVLFADGLTKTHRSALIRKIERLSGKHFQSVIRKIDMNIYGRSENGEILLVLEDIRQAIAEGRQLQFRYCDIGIDFQPHPRKGDDDEPRLYTVSPYQIIAKNGHQYLISNLEPHEDLTHFRIDRIRNSHVLGAPARPLRSLHGFENGLQLSEYVKAHPNLWSGAPAHITFRCESKMMNDVADAFGTELQIEKQADGKVLVHVHAAEKGMLHWALQFADAVEVLSPQSLREQIAETLRGALEKYEGEG